MVTSLTTVFPLISNPPLFSALPSLEKANLIANVLLSHFWLSKNQVFYVFFLCILLVIPSVFVDLSAECFFYVYFTQYFPFHSYFETVEGR